MMKETFKAFVLLGKYLTEKQEIESIIDKAHQHNTWFNHQETTIAINAWANLLTQEKIEQWLSNYELRNENPKRVGLILAGNIPMVGFHDVCCVLLSGNTAVIKLSSQDNVLIPALLNKLIEFEPLLSSKIEFVERMNNIDAIIATGSNNTAKHFEYYFSKIPHIIRKNRNSIAILSGVENIDDFKNLGEDIFRYYGQGCRNVSKIYVPRDYNFSPLLDALETFSYVADQHKYFNNYNYYKSIYLVNREHHLDNGFLLLKENKSMQAPLSVLYFEYYDDVNSLNEEIKNLNEEIQCIVALEKSIYNFKTLNFGESQKPGWMDYADGIDTMEFLNSKI